MKAIIICFSSDFVPKSANSWTLGPLNSQQNVADFEQDAGGLFWLHSVNNLKYDLRFIWINIFTFFFIVFQQFYLISSSQISSTLLGDILIPVSGFQLGSLPGVLESNKMHHELLF